MKEEGRKDEGGKMNAKRKTNFDSSFILHPSSFRLAILETSHRCGWVALALGAKVLATRPLQEARRHTRDLAPMLSELLAEQGWKARDLDGVIVSRGPGSYTGLRVGVMSAKTLAYATGCALLAVDTFAAIALQAGSVAPKIDVIADAQQEKIYVQQFSIRAGSVSDGQQPASPSPRTVADASGSDNGTVADASGSELRIVAFDEWKSNLTADVRISGPGLEIFSARLPAEQLAAAADWLPRPESLLQLALERFRAGQRDDPFAVEPLYLRPSSAEEKLSSPSNK